MKSFFLLPSVKLMCCWYVWSANYYLSLVFMGFQSLQCPGARYNIEISRQVIERGLCSSHPSAWPLRLGDFVLLLMLRCQAPEVCALLWNNPSLWAQPGCTCTHGSISDLLLPSLMVACGPRQWCCDCWHCEQSPQSLHTSCCWTLFRRLFSKIQQTVSTGRAEINWSAASQPVQGHRRCPSQTAWKALISFGERNCHETEGCWILAGINGKNFFWLLVLKRQFASQTNSTLWPTWPKLWTESQSQPDSEKSTFLELHFYHYRKINMNPQGSGDEMKKMHSQ